MNEKDRDNLIYVSSQIDKLESYIVGVDEDGFLRNDILKDACLMKLMVIGEYSSKISDEMKARFSEIQWQLLKAARNYYAHVYNAISWIIVWETLNTSIPELKKKIQYILEEISED